MSTTQDEKQEEVKNEERERRNQAFEDFDLNLLDGATCPITLSLMVDPVVLIGDGQTYERRAIESWLGQGHKTSPLSGAKLESLSIIPNYAMKTTIDQLRKRFSSNEIANMEAQVKPKLSRKASKIGNFVAPPSPNAPNGPNTPSAPLAPSGSFEDENELILASGNEGGFSFGSSTSVSTAPSALSAPLAPSAPSAPFYPSFDDDNEEGKEKDYISPDQKKKNDKEKISYSSTANIKEAAALQNRYALVLAGGYGSGHVNNMSGGFETYVNDTNEFDVWTRKFIQKIPESETDAVSFSGSQVMTGTGLNARIWAMERTENAEEIEENRRGAKFVKRLFNKYMISEEERARREEAEAKRLQEVEQEREESMATPFGDPSWKWSLATDLPGHRDRIVAISIAHNNTFAVTGSIDGRVHFWYPKVHDDNSTWTMKNSMFHGDEESPVRAVEIHGANSLENHIPEWYASGGDDWCVRVWDSLEPTRQLVEYKYSAHTMPISCLCSASYGHNMLFSTCRDGKLFAWAPKSGSPRPIMEFKDSKGDNDYFALSKSFAHEQAIISLAVDASYGGEGPRWIATGGEDGFLKIWDTRMQRLLNILACPSKAGLEDERRLRMPWSFVPTEVEETPGMDYLKKTKNSFYDESQWEGVEVSNKDYIKVAKSSPDGRFLIRVDGTNEVAIYDTTTWEEITAFDTEMRNIHDCSLAILS